MKAVTQGANQFCGPAVLSIITGKSTDECAQVIGAISGRYEVREVKIPDLLQACKKLRFNTEKINTVGYSIFGTITGIINSPGMYIVAVRRHVVAVEVTEDKQALLCDNHTKEPINAASAARLGQRVEDIYKITAKPEPKLLSEEVVSSRTYNSIYFKLTRFYEDPEDNVTRNLGYITGSKKELEKIYEALGKELNNV